MCLLISGSLHETRVVYISAAGVVAIFYFFIFNGGSCSLEVPAWNLGRVLSTGFSTEWVMSSPAMLTMSKQHNSLAVDAP